MHFDSFFRQFFGHPYPFRRPSEEDENETGDPFRPTNDNQMWSSELDQLISTLLQESFPMFSELPFHEAQRNSEFNKSPGSLRDQMLKPGDKDLFGKSGWEPERSSKADKDLDDTVKNNGNLDLLFPKANDDRNMHYSTRSSMNYFHSSNGATETKSTANDREGCHRELITREFDGKKYVLEKRQCPGAPEQTTETLVNLTKEELPEFLKNWKTDDATSTQNMFFNFFGSLK